MSGYEGLSQDYYNSGSNQQTITNPDIYYTDSIHHSSVSSDDQAYKQDIKDAQNLAKLTEKLARGEKRIRNLRILERVVNLVAALAVAGIMGYTLEKYIRHGNERVDGTGPFGSNPKLWPTYVMSSVAVITLLFNLSVLLAYCCGRKAADRVASYSSWIKLLSPIGHLIIWGSGAGSFRAASDGTDIWTFSCSEEPSVVAIQKNFENKISYEQLCTLNTASLYTAFGTAGFAVLSIIIWMIVTVYEKRQKRRSNDIEKAKKFESVRSSSSSYNTHRVTHSH